MIVVKIRIAVTCTQKINMICLLGSLVGIRQPQQSVLFHVGSLRQAERFKTPAIT